MTMESKTVNKGEGELLYPSTLVAFVILFLETVP